MDSGQREIINAVNSYYGVDLWKFNKSKKNKPIKLLLGLKMAIYLLKEKLNMANKDIGFIFGVSKAFVSIYLTDIKGKVNTDNKVRLDCGNIISLLQAPNIKLQTMSHIFATNILELIKRETMCVYCDDLGELRSQYREDKLPNETYEQWLERKLVNKNKTENVEFDKKLDNELNKIIENEL